MFDPVDARGRLRISPDGSSTGAPNSAARSDIAEQLDDRGVSLTVSTNRHILTLSCTCLTDDFDEVFSIVADVARRPTFPEDEIAKRRAEAQTILRQRDDNPAARAVDAVMELLYTRPHPYGLPPKGTAAGIERISRGDLAAFHSRRCRPGALSVAIVGDIAASHAVQRARLELEDWTAEPPDAHRHPFRFARDRGTRGADPDARQAADGDRVRVRHHSPARSAVLRLLDDEQHPRAVRSRGTTGGQHPRAAGNGVLRFQHARRGARRSAAAHQGWRRSGQRRGGASRDRDRGARRSLPRDRR